MDEKWSEGIRHRLEQFEQYTIDVIYGRIKGPGVVVYGMFLQGLSLLFNAIVQMRYFLYRKRIIHDQPLGCLTVVVGNLTVGGTGKTPVVEKFARSLHARGRKVAILSRGYGSKSQPKYKRLWRWITHAPEPPPKIVSDGDNLFLDSWEAGDEPYMLARNLPGVVVLVDKNRVKAGEYAIKKMGADTLLLDDGFQYLPMRGQLHLLLVDKTNPFGNRNLLPRGILREPVKHLKRASYIFLTKSDGEPDEELEAMIRKYKPDTELIECTHQPKYLKQVFGKEQWDLDWLRGKRVVSFSGIATPESFEAFLRTLGAEIVHNKRFLDHHRFTQHELEELFSTAQDVAADVVVTTEKDAVRIDPAMVDERVLFVFLRLEVEILSGVDDFEQAVSRVCFPKQQNIKATRSPFIRDVKMR
jgi:tetraacyldisaccharide 4'-kinase